jgi:hypothetical protein
MADERRLNHNYPDIAQPNLQMASIQSLPPEILAEIATFVAHEQGQPAIELLTVCRHWKEAIYSSPPAWSALSIPCTSDRDETALQVISSWITRSVVSPLFVLLDLDEADGQTIPILSPHSPLVHNRDRIRELHIARASAWNLWTLNTLWPALNLVTLHITHAEAPPFASFLELLELPFFLRNTPQAPRLRHLRLHHCEFVALTCPPEGVLELDISSSVVSPMGIRQMMASFQDLRRLSLGPKLRINFREQEEFSAYIEAIEDGSLKNIVLPSLNSLDLHLHDSTFPVLLNNLSTPSLTHLNVVIEGISFLSTIKLQRFLGQEEMPLYNLDLTLVTPPPKFPFSLPVLKHMKTFRMTAKGLEYDFTDIWKHISLVKFRIKLEPVPIFIAPSIQELKDTKCFDIQYTREGDR